MTDQDKQVIKKEHEAVTATSAVNTSGNSKARWETLSHRVRKDLSMSNIRTLFSLLWSHTDTLCYSFIRILGSAIAGASELALFHPVDTIAKRLMSTETRIVAANVSGTALNLNQAIFRESCNKTAIQKFGSLFPGVGFGAAYKILQRVYKFGGQPVLQHSLGQKYGVEFENRFGHQNGRTMIAAVSGSLIGIGEVFLLPLDALKVKAQTAPEQLKGRGVVDIFAKEGFGLYRGAGWTAARVS
jgi:hypothetical protein